MESKQIPLNMMCPTLCGNNKAYTWVHSTCSQTIYLKGNGNLRCDYCYKEENFLEWRFACEKHQGEYNEPDFMAVVNALGAAVQACKSYFSNAKESLEFLSAVQSKLLEKSYK